MIVTFYVKDSKTNAPIADAYVKLTCQFAGGGTIPYEGHSDSNGKVEIDIDGNTPVLYWSVKANGYQDVSGSNDPPSTVYMNPLSSTPSTTTSTFIILGIIFLVIILLLLSGKKS